MLPRITVDETRCSDPMNCRQCLLVCPTRVLGLHAKVPPQKFRETDSKDYAIKGVHLLACSGCMDCVHICPQQALQVSFNGGG